MNSHDKVRMSLHHLKTGEEPCITRRDGHGKLALPSEGENQNRYELLRKEALGSFFMEYVLLQASEVDTELSYWLEAKMIDKALFICAFFSLIWILMLFLSWAIVPSWSNEKKSAKIKYMEYCSNTDNGLTHTVYKFLFAIFNAHTLFPIRGLLVALFFIFLFILYKRIS